MEVPFISSSSVKWIEASIPTTAINSNLSAAVSVAHLTKDSASCSVFGPPSSPIYLVWRICKKLPRAIELFEVHADKELPMVGLRILFPEALSPFAYICKNEINSGYGSVYLLYVLSVSGVAYLLSLKDVSAYDSSFIFSSNEFLHINTSVTPDSSPITSATATAGCLILGRDDGSVNCFQLGVIDENAQGFMYELRDDAALSRLWGLVSRNRLAASVKDLVMSDIHGRKVVFALHSDGNLRVWDLQRRGKIFSQSVGDQGITPLRLWVGLVDGDTCSIPLAILHEQCLEVEMQGVGIYRINFPPGQTLSLSLVSPVQYIPLCEGLLLDVKFSSNKLWVLKEDGLLEWDLMLPNIDWEEKRCYSMQEGFVAEQLFQSSENCLDDLYQTTCSIFSSSKAQIIGFLSSIVLRRLLRPEVFSGNVLRSTLQDYDKHWPDNEYKALSVDELKREILLLIEHQAVSGSPFSAFKCWKDFLSRYFDRWCKSNVPFSLLADPASGAVGLIRENAVSLFRSLEDIELLMYGTFEEFEDFLKLGVDSLNDGLEREILYEVLCCTRQLSRRLGPSISPILYESVVGVSMISSEDIVPRLLKTVESGYNASASLVTLNVSELGADFVWQKEVSDHKSLRKFSIDTLISIHGLCKKGNGWGRVLGAIESYLNLLVLRKSTENLESEVVFSANTSIMVQATSQVAETMFKSAFELLLFLTYIIDISGQVHMLPHDKAKIQLELIPMIQEIIAEWLIIHFLATKSSESLLAEDFSSQLSSLTIDNNSSRRSWTEKLGSVDLTLAFILLLDARDSSKAWRGHSLSSLPNPGTCINLTRHLSSWMIWGRSGEMTLHVFGHSIELAISLLRHRQYDAVENLLMVMDAHLKNEKLSGSVQSSDGEWCVIQHLLGCCLLAQAQRESHGPLKDKKVREAMRYFFRASSGEGAAVALHNFLAEVGLSHLNNSGSSAAWKLYYYQLVMQKFEQFGISDAAGQFALAALEHVVDTASPESDASKAFFTDESASSIKGRLWANVFKFSLDLDQYYDAYCAIVSNPDDESKNICLRRFIIVLYERGATKVLCNSHLPLIGLIDKTEQELAWKAACADISAKPHPYKLLYAFEMHHQNWRKAATYIYLYSVQLQNDMSIRKYQNTSHALQERLNGISAAINCLHLVHPMHAWISSQLIGNELPSDTHPSKRARMMGEQPDKGDSETQKQEFYISIEKLEDEFVVTSAEYMLCLANAKWTRTGSRTFQEDLVDHLVDANLYDMAFTVVLRFLKGSLLKRELERVFSALALRCCPSRENSPMVGTPGLLLTYSKDETLNEAPFDVESKSQQQRISQWEVLEQNLEKYKGFHGRLPAVIAETLLRSDPHIELPLWLVDMFKGRREHIGMSGQESSPATLFGLYVDYGRFPEATELLIDYIEAYGSVRPAGIIHRKRPLAAWFPYTAIERLWCHLEESIRVGHMIEQCEKLKTLLHGALRSHLILLKTDSEDVSAVL